MEQLEQDSQLSVSNNWQALESKKEMVAHTKVGQGGVLYVRSEGVVNAPVSEVLHLLTDISQRKSFDEMFKEAKVFEDLGNNIMISYLRFKAQWPVADRDMITLSGIVHKNNKIYSIGTSIDYSDYKQSGCVRSDLKIAGWILTSKQNATHCVYMVCNDPKGDIPDMVKKWAASKQAYVIEKIQKIFNKKYGPKK